MKEEMEVVMNVLTKKRLLKFNPDKEDIEWENGPFAKEVARGKRNTGEFNKKSSVTLKNYISKM